MNNQIRRMLPSLSTMSLSGQMERTLGCTIDWSLTSPVLFETTRKPFATVPMHGRSKRSKGKEVHVDLPLKNDEIRARTLRVVFPEGRETRIVSLGEAKEEAARLGLDLVLASPQADPPVARIVSWEKMVYSMRQKQKAQERAAREHKKLASPKEIRIGCHIAPHDLEIKMASARKILQEHHQVLKVSVVFRGGREVEPAKLVLDNILDALHDVGRVKDSKHLQKPHMNRWAVQLEPIPTSSPP